MKDRREGGRVFALYLKIIKEPRRIKCGQHTVYFRDRRPKFPEQRFSRNALTLVKLGLALTLVGCASQPTNDPLPRVPRNVQKKIPDTVRFGIGPPPDLLVTQILETPLDLWN